MGECGCGETNVQQAFELPDKTVLGYQLYHGCRDCFTGPGISIYLFDRKGAKEWIDRFTLKQREQITPDEYGGNNGAGISFGLFEIQDLRAAAKELQAHESIEAWEGDFEGWLDDQGLEWIQLALTKFKQRMESVRREKRK